MKLESLVGYACDVIERTLDEMARDQPSSPSEHVNESYQHTFPQTDLTPNTLAQKVYEDIVAVINQALKNKDYKVSEALQDPELPLGSDDAGVFLVKNPMGSFTGEIAVIAADPRALSKVWKEIIVEAKQIAKQRDLGRDDKPLT